MSVSAPVHMHHDSPDTVGRRDRLGVILLIVADIAFVGSLIFTYLYLRFLNTEGAWLPEGMTPAPSTSTWLVVICLLIGLFTITWGVRGMKGGHKSQLVIGAGIALLASIVAAVLQFHQIASYDFPLNDKGYFAGTYSSSIVTLAGANAFHLILTIVITLGIFNRARMGKYTDPASWQPRIAVYWWLWIVISAVLVGLMTTYVVSSPYIQ